MTKYLFARSIPHFDEVGAPLSQNIFVCLALLNHVFSSCYFQLNVVLDRFWLVLRKFKVGDLNLHVHTLTIMGGFYINFDDFQKNLKPLPKVFHYMVGTCSYYIKL